MTGPKRLRIQVVYTTTLSTFVRRDIEMLSKRHDVSAVFSKDAGSLFKAMRGARKNDVSVLWFATMTSAAVVLASKLFRKPTILIIGGADVAKLPEYRYGLLARPFYKIFPEMAIKRATAVLAVDEGLVEDVRKNANIDRKDIKVVPTGYDSEKYRPSGQKERVALTVCSGSTWERLRIKGVDTFIEVSKLVPDARFVVVGLHGKIADEVRAMSKGNLEVVGELDEPAVIRAMQEAKVYCQFSVREGLPNALCEAMLCECVPVGTDVQGVRTAIGDAGLLVPLGDADAAAKAVVKALDSDMGPSARQRIAEKFRVEDREKALDELIAKLVKKDEK